MHTISRTLILGTLLAILVAACSSGGGTAVPGRAGVRRRPSAKRLPAKRPRAKRPRPPQPVAPRPSWSRNRTSARSWSMAKGETLYMFKPDTAGESTCYDDCEANWPPLVVTGDITVGEGLDAATFTTVARTDGSTQVKAGAWPLYYFKNDAAAGDVNGQGQGDVWYVVSPTGEPIED